MGREAVKQSFGSSGTTSPKNIKRDIEDFPSQPKVYFPISNDLSQRISLGTWHPAENTFCVAKHNSLFIFAEKRSSSNFP